VFSVSQLTRDIPTSKDAGEQITEATLCFDDSPLFADEDEHIESMAM
jgi:hypothetical protein